MSQLYGPETRNCRGGSAVGESSAEPGESAGGERPEGVPGRCPLRAGGREARPPLPTPSWSGLLEVGIEVREEKKFWLAAALRGGRGRAGAQGGRRGAVRFGRAGAAGGAGSGGPAQRPQRPGREAVRAGAAGAASVGYGAGGLRGAEPAAESDSGGRNCELLFGVLCELVSAAGTEAPAGLGRARGSAARPELFCQLPRPGRLPDRGVRSTGDSRTSPRPGERGMRDWESGLWAAEPRQGSAGGSRRSHGSWAASNAAAAAGSAAPGLAAAAAAAAAPGRGVGGPGRRGAAPGCGAPSGGAPDRPCAGRLGDRLGGAVQRRDEPQGRQRATHAAHATAETARLLLQAARAQGPLPPGEGEGGKGPPPRAGGRGAAQLGPVPPPRRRAPPGGGVWGRGPGRESAGPSGAGGALCRPHTPLFVPPQGQGRLPCPGTPTGPGLGPGREGERALAPSRSPAGPRTPHPLLGFPGLTGRAAVGVSP